MRLPRALAEMPSPRCYAGLFRAAEWNHKGQKGASLLKREMLWECLYPSSLRKLHPPFQQEGGLTGNSLGLIFQLQKLQLKKNDYFLMIISKRKESSHKNESSPGTLVCACTCVPAHEAIRTRMHVGAGGRQDVIWKLNSKNRSSQLLLGPLVYAWLTADTPLNTSFWDIIAAGKLYSSTKSPVKTK